jgi:peroxiredoxin
MKILLLNIFIFCSTTISAQINYESYLRKSDSLVQLNVGKQFPSFKAMTLNKEIISEKQLLGKVTIFNFWFQYCAPCIAEFDDLNSLYQKFKNVSAFQFISFTIDSSEAANESVIKYKLPFLVCPISEKECFRLNFNQGFPTTIIVDKSGKIVFIKSGGSLEKEEIGVDIQKLAYILEKLL